MPYGKYKNTPIGDLPPTYLEWFAQKGFPAGQIGRLLALAHGLQLNGLIGLFDPLRRR